VIYDLKYSHPHLNSPSNRKFFYECWLKGPFSKFCPLSPGSSFLRHWQCSRSMLRNVMRTWN